MGGIQVYLWELWSRLDPGSFSVLTASSHPDAKTFDASQARRGIRIERVRSPVLVPSPRLAKTVRDLAARTDARLVVIDPALPLGLMGPALGMPYAVVLHGAELAAPARVPLARGATREVLARSALALCAGEYPAEEVRRLVAPGRGRSPHMPREPQVVVVPPGVDISRFRPIDAEQKARTRRLFGLPSDGPLVVSVSRLVPRKGMDVLIRAGAGLMASFPDLTIAIGGVGRDSSRLQRLIDSSGAPVRLLGRVEERALPDLYGAADVFVMACRDRWHGLEQEGFGIVFLEAAACGVPQVAGRSGGAAEAVADGETGIVVGDPADPGEVAIALRRLLSEPELRASMGEAARRRAVESYDYDGLSLRLAGALRQMEG
ncbi:MAG: glycosyltransferase family 4 protein [Acidimicrobiales bacterium]